MIRQSEDTAVVRVAYTVFGRGRLRLRKEVALHSVSSYLLSWQLNLTALSKSLYVN